MLFIIIPNANNYTHIYSYYSTTIATNDINYSGVIYA